MKRLPIMLGALTFAFLLAALSAGTSRNASAQQTTVPDLTQFGFPQVVGTVTYTPGQTETITAGNQQVVLPADFISKTVKFELLQGDPASFAPTLPITDQGRTIVVAWAFRVTDVASNQLIGRFDKPVQWSVTDPGIATGSAVYNTTAANPPVITPNATPGTITGTTLSHTFGGAGVGWLALGPPGAAAATATAAPTSAPTEVPTVAPPSRAGGTETATSEPTVPIGMPSTGGPQYGPEVALLVLVALAAAAVGVVLRRRRASQ